MEKLKNEEMCLAEALADLHGKPAGIIKVAPQMMTGRVPVEQRSFAEALANSCGDQEQGKKQEPVVGTGPKASAQQEGGK